MSATQIPHVKIQVDEEKTADSPRVWTWRDVFTCSLPEKCTRNLSLIGKIILVFIGIAFIVGSEFASNEFNLIYSAVGWMLIVGTFLFGMMQTKTIWQDIISRLMKQKKYFLIGM